MRATGRQRKGGSGSGSAFLGGWVSVDLFPSLFLGLGVGMKPQKPGEWRPLPLTLCRALAPLPSQGCSLRGLALGRASQTPRPFSHWLPERSCQGGWASGSWDKDCTGVSPHSPTRSSAFPLATGPAPQHGGQAPGRRWGESWGHLPQFGESRACQAPLPGPGLFLRNRRGCETSEAR